MRRPSSSLVEVEQAAAELAPTPIEQDISAWLVRRRVESKDWKRDGHAIRRIVAAAGWTTIAEGNPAKLGDVLAEMRAKGLTGRTVNRLQSLVSVFLDWVHDRRPHDVPVNWAKLVRRASEDDATDGSRFLVLEELALLLAHCPVQARRGATPT